MNNKTLYNYRIIVSGLLEERANRYFEGYKLILNPSGETQIECYAIDQSGLHGVLNRIRDLGLELRSLQQLEPQNNENLQTK